jgi:flagellar motor component MotA
MGSVLGGCLVAYGSEWGTAFKLRPNREEAAIAVGVYKLAARMSIGSGFFGAMYGWIAMLGSSAGGGGMDMDALYGGLAFSLITILYGLVFAFTLFLPLQYYFQHQLDKDS